MSTVLNIESLRTAPLQTDPFPFFTVERSIDDALVAGILEDFPEIEDGGSFNVEDVEISPRFQQFLQSIDSPEFRQVIRDKFAVDVMDLPMMMTLRGYSRKKDGRIHTDSKTKIATILIYLNEQWPSVDGRLRILRDADNMDDYVAEITPGPGSLVAFKVTDNCWHGYPSYEGTRRSIQINFLTSEGASSKHRFFHKLSAKLKALLRRNKTSAKR